MSYLRIVNQGSPSAQLLASRQINRNIVGGSKYRWSSKYRRDSKLPFRANNIFQSGY